jgi:hypothetical protein
MNDPQVMSTEPALGISVQCGAGECQIVFQTHVPQVTDKATLDALVDRLTAVAARQKAKVTLDELERNRESNVVQLTNMREDRARVEAVLTAPQEGRRGDRRNEQDLRTKREQADANEKRLLEIIGRFDKEIAAAKAVIAGD